MKIHYINQGSEDWEALRLGRVGGSQCCPLLTNGKSDNGLGVGAQTLVYQKIEEYVTGESPSYTNAAMERGTEYEPLARREYENQTFTSVQEVGYISIGDCLGVSPDGLVGDVGGIEIKCPGGAEFARFADTRKIEKKYFAQMQWFLWITGREWCDFVMYHPDFSPNLIIERVYPDPETFERFSEQVPKYVAEFDRVLSLCTRNVS